MKKCQRCGVEQAEEDFGKDSRSKTGRVSTCKKCLNAGAVQRYSKEAKGAYYAANREAIRKKQAKGYQDNKARILSKCKQRYFSKRQELLEQKRAYHENNREKCVERIRASHTRARAEMDGLKSSACLDCGGFYPPHCMDFDHLPGTEKVKNVGALYKSTKAKLLEEVAKCDLVCKVCHRVRTAQRRPPRKRRNPAVESRYEYVSEIKRGGCSVCGGTFSPEAMDFHHVDPSSKVTEVSALIRVASLERLKAEVQKCCLLCANCHADLHFREGR